MNSVEMPERLKHIIGYEKIDFIISFKSEFPFKSFYILYIVAFIFFALPFGLVLSIIIPLFKGENVEISSKNSIEIGNWNNLEPLIIPLSVSSVFLVIGCAFVTWALLKLFKSGGYYVGTENALFHFTNGKAKSFSWKQFTDMMVDIKSKNIYLNARSLKNDNQNYTTRNIIIPVEGNLAEVGKICRQRIKENNPTQI